MTIWKFPFLVAKSISLRMPKGAQVLSVQMQGDQPTIWALCEPDAPETSRRFNVFGTGWDFDANGRGFVGTIQDSGGFVWHVFEVQS